MVTRVIGIPDQNGLIPISCGGDIIEIQVASAPAPSLGGGIGGAKAPPTNPFENPFALIAKDIGANRLRFPARYIASTATTGSLDTSGIVKQVVDQIADETQENPRAVILGMNSVNLHEVSELGQKIASEAPDVPIAIDFGGLLKQ